MHISQIESFGDVVILGLIETLLCRIMKCFFFSFNNVNVYPIKIHWVVTKYGLGSWNQIPVIATMEECQVNMFTTEQSGGRFMTKCPFNKHSGDETLFIFEIASC